jgi:4-carboxymuconolactone decarboxylase
LLIYLAIFIAIGSLGNACQDVPDMGNIVWLRMATIGNTSAPIRKPCLKQRSPARFIAYGLQSRRDNDAESDGSKSNGNQKMTDISNVAMNVCETLSLRQQAIMPIAAFAAAGNIEKLNKALHRGLDAGLSVNDVKEILVQLYAYAGFPRSLNALGELMKVLDARKQRGIEDVPGASPTQAIPQGAALLAAGTANQTRLAGGPVRGPLFDFAPAIDEYLKSHLFGDIFERDNLDWQSRELATVGMLSALPGTDSQLQSHIRISMNVGLSTGQLQQLTMVLAEHVDTENGQRASAALERHLASMQAR